MQIKAIFIFLIFLISNSISYAQLKWVMPLTYGLQPIDGYQRLYFKYENGKTIYVNDMEKIIEVDFPFDRSIGYSYFTFLKDGFYGCKKLGIGEIFPPGFDRIETLTDNFFLLSVYGICKLVTKDNKILLPYDCNNMKFYNYNHDTILYMSIIKMDTTWGGFLANGNKIDPLVAA
ncbi:MAG TPA: hypothetical protein VK590_15960, partial [Saprospiraceae bacterium]|nr:hypothetical protein [Saprospiraceae bacterium]